MDKIVCIGKNYPDHIKEMAHLERNLDPAVKPRDDIGELRDDIGDPRDDIGDPRDDIGEQQDDNTSVSSRGRTAVSSSPVIFLKPPSILQTIKNLHTGKLKYLPDFGSIHYETELILRISKGCYKIPPENGLEYFDAVSIGLDMTRRDLQTTQKEQGLPWTTSKVFPDSAVCGEWLEIKNFPDFENKLFSFTLNGVQRQTGKAHEMILSCSQCISYISQFFKLLPGDMIYTGTPAGVGTVKIGDVAQLQYHHLNYSVEWVS